MRTWLVTVQRCTEEIVRIRADDPCSAAHIANEGRGRPLAKKAPTFKVLDVSKEVDECST